MTTNLEKIRPDDVLGNLTDEQQNSILDWCETHSFRAVLEKIAAPPPDGLGLQVHYTSLRRFYQKHFAERFVRERTETMAQLSPAASDAECSDLAPFWLLAKEALEKAVFTRLQKDEFDQREIASLLRLALRMEDQRLKWSHWHTDCERVKNECSEISFRRAKEEKADALFVAMLAQKKQQQGQSPKRD